MTPREVYNLKRKNFILKTKDSFGFLVSEFGFRIPEHFKTKQVNGEVIQDKFEYG